MSSVTWIASYPMRENPWIRFMLASYLLDAQITSFDILNNKLPEQALLLSSGMMVPLHGAGQTIVETHFLPEAEVMRRYGKLTGKVVYVARDPRTVVLNSVRDLHVSEAKRTEFVKDFIAHGGPGLFIENGSGTWLQNVQQWTYPAVVGQYFPEVEVLTVRYEDMVDDAVAILRRIVEFLDLADGGEGRVERAVENGSIERFNTIRQAERTRGASSLRATLVARPIGQKEDEPSWSELGAEADAAYRQWLQEDEEFRLCVQHLGYEACSAE
ncbi:MAG TPA: sulfotransferase domain-containing protein [Streptosporangiaceae bacterium]|nr:sulfotransferase domain-containing protein [Streptosporangiaceae bacterium]